MGYSKLVMHSFGFQNALDKGITKGDVFFPRVRLLPQTWEMLTKVS